MEFQKPRQRASRMLTDNSGDTDAGTTRGVRMIVRHGTQLARFLHIHSLANDLG
jgi:hypothetical protein